MNSNNPAPPRPLVTPKAKLAHGIDRSQFRPEIASDPELVVKMTHMVFGEVGRHAPLPVKIIQLETAFNRAQARGQTLAHVLLSVKESPSDGYYAIDTYCAAAEPTPEEVETFKKTVLTAVLHGSNLSDVGYGPMTGNASADVAAHQFAKGDPGYQLQAGDAYFREGPFINDFAEISPSTLCRARRQQCHQLWLFRRAILQAQQRPHPPILLSGRRTIGFVAFQVIQRWPAE